MPIGEAVLLLLMLVAVIAQHWLIPEGLNPFEKPSAPTNQILFQFNLKPMTFFVDGQEFSSLSDEFSSSDRKEGRLGFIVPKSIDRAIYRIHDFYFLLELISNRTTISVFNGP